MLVLPFLHGGLAIGCLAIGVAFLKYWWLTRDRFFIWFAVAFWTFACGWVLRTFLPDIGEHAHLIYVPRLVGFLLILLAIFNKNRRAPG